VFVFKATITKKTNQRENARIKKVLQQVQSIRSEGCIQNH